MKYVKRSYQEQKDRDIARALVKHWNNVGFNYSLRRYSKRF